MSYFEHKDAPLEHFFSISPRSKKWVDDYGSYDIGALPLRVIKNDGVSVDEGFNFTSTPLNADDNGVVRKNYHNGGYSGISFKVRVLLKPTDSILGINDGTVEFVAKQYMDYLTRKKATHVTSVELIQYIAQKPAAVNVVTMAVDVPDGLYIIKDIKSKKQTYEGFTIWELEFESYLPAKKLTFQNTNTGVTKAVNAYKANKKVMKQVNKLTKNKLSEADKKAVVNEAIKNLGGADSASSAKKSKVKEAVKDALNEVKWEKCELSQIQYSKTKKTTKCVEYMQKALHKKGYIKDKKDIDGWYGKATAKAVKKFQSDYAKKYKLKVNGVVDKETLKVLKKI